MLCAARRDDVVFGGGGLSMMKMQANVRESVAKVEEGIKFFARGLRLVGSDIATSVRLVLFAATGVLTSEPLPLTAGYIYRSLNGYCLSALTIG